ncbi:MAG: helix-turn-helix domain-containing protein [Acidobacteriia bacterium]|nr:helix-turn-helix domain-containing protein [Terriglobia bacterium]
MKQPVQKKGILVLHKMLDILETIRESRSGLALADLSRALGLPKLTAYRIVATLESRGHISRNAAGHYLVARKLYDLQPDVSEEQALLQAAQPVMAKLVDSRSYPGAGNLHAQAPFRCRGQGDQRPRGISRSHAPDCSRGGSTPDRPVCHEQVFP